MARLFVVDRNAAEDLVQEAFIRLSRSLDRIKDDAKVVAYLRSIVLNLARDHNRRGLVSMRHQPPADDLDPASVEDHLVGREDQHEVLEALRHAAGAPARLPDAALPPRSRHPRDRRHPRPVAELGQDPPPAGPRRARAAIGGPVDEPRSKTASATRSTRAPPRSSPRPISSPGCSAASTRTAGAAGGAPASPDSPPRVLAALAAVLLLVTDRRNGEWTMDWWIFEVLVTARARRHRGPARAVHQALREGATPPRSSGRTPAPGKSFIVLTDVAYYLIFTAYILFTAKFDPPSRLGRHGQRRSGAVRARRGSAASC